MCVGYVSWPVNSMEEYIESTIDVCRVFFWTGYFYGKII